MKERVTFRITLVFPEHSFIKGFLGAHGLLTMDDEFHNGSWVMNYIHSESWMMNYIHNGCLTKSHQNVKSLIL